MKNKIIDKITEAINKFRDYREDVCKCCNHKRVVNDNGMPKIIVVPKYMYIELLKSDSYYNNMVRGEGHFMIGNTIIVPEYDVLVIKEDIC